MNALIAITQTRIGDAQVQAVDARELHGFLGVGRDFTSWMKDRICKYGFVQSIDFSVLESAPQNGGAGNRGMRTEYALSLDMAKELAMVENNDKGRQARRYFIECERRLHDTPPPPNFQVPQSLPEALRLAADLADSNKVLTAENEAMRPAVEAHHRIAEAEGSLCMRDAAKVLQIRPIDLRNWLLVQHWIYGRPGHSGWLAYQDKSQQGVMIHKLNTLQRQDGTEKIVEQPRLTPKGIARIAEALREKAA